MMTTSNPRVTVCVVAYKHRELEDRCLRKLRQSSEPGEYLLDFIDNGVINAPLAWVWNTALRRCKTEFLVLLNTDAFVTPDWIPSLLWPLGGVDVIASGPVTNRCGSLQNLKKRESEFFGRFDLTTDRDWTDDEIDAVANVVRREFGPGSSLRTSSPLSGFCLCLDVQKTLYIGGFRDEMITFYGQETELLQRAARRGFGFAVARSCYVHHLGGETRKKRVLEEGFDVWKDKDDAGKLIRILSSSG